jgi:hypothetical protein
MRVTRSDKVYLLDTYSAITVLVSLMSAGLQQSQATGIRPTENRPAPSQSFQAFSITA